MKGILENHFINKNTSFFDVKLNCFTELGRKEMTSYIDKILVDCKVTGYSTLFRFYKVIYVKV